MSASEEHNKSLIDECRTRLCKSLSDITSQIDLTKTALILSGGVDTCAILEAASSQNIAFHVGLTVVASDTSPDEGFARAAAKQHGLDHVIVRMNSLDLIETYLARTIELLEVWDSMTLRNSLVIAAVFEKAQSLGMKYVITGDAADELFGGYSFMWGSEDNPEAWLNKRNTMCRKWTFATAKLAESYGLTPYSPYMQPEFVEWALANTTRNECIGEYPIRLRYGDEAMSHITGKVILRKAFSTVSSWRRKDPIEVGSGITVIGHDEFWSDIISDEEFDKHKEELKDEGIQLKNKEHCVTFREYRNIFGGIVHPTKRRHSIGKGCAGCCFEIGEENFCRLCGAWPAQRDAVIKQA